MDVTKAEVVIVIGANPTREPPGRRRPGSRTRRSNGTKLIVCDPRRSDLARHAHRYLQFKPDTDVALLNAMMHVIVAEGLVDEAFIASRTIGYDELRENVDGYSPEAMAPICGIDAETIRDVARLYATSQGLDDPVGHGHLAARARHRQRALPDRAVADDRPDRPARHRPASAARPEQRAGRVRRRPDPDDVPRLPARRRARRCARASSRPGACPRARSTTQSGPDGGRGDARDQGTAPCAACTCMGENPAMSDPDANHAREALAALEHLVVQDIFLTETAYLADVILPASAFPEKTGTFTNTDRLVQMGRQALDPPGDARQDLWIIQQIAKRHGPADWHDEPGLGGVRRDAPDDAEHRRHHLGAARARARRHLPVHEGRRPGPVGRLHRRLPARRRQGALRAGRHHPGRRAARCRVPDGADHRPPARALAHRQHDAARHRARRDRARPGRARPSARPGGASAASRATW